MPPTANRVRGKTSVVVAPARTAAASCAEPGAGSTLSGEGVSAQSVEAFGHGEDAEGRKDQDRALQEQRGPIHDHSAGQRDALMVQAQNDRAQRGDQGNQGDAHLSGIALCPRGKGLHKNTDHGPAKDDQHRRDGAVVDLGGDELRHKPGQRGDHLTAPSAAEGFVAAGSVTPT